MRILCGTSLKVLSAAVALALPACVRLPPLCSGGLSPMVEAHLFFGDEIGGGAVTAGEWQEFIDSEVTPRFPAGLTVLTTTGQWRRADWSIVRESGHELIIILAPADSAEEILNEIRSAYMRRFRQESVLLAEAPACAGF